MKSFRTAIVLTVAIMLVTAVSAAPMYAQSRGAGRIAGKVVDEKGQPLANVVVKAQKVGETDTFEGKTNDKGEWAIGRVADGEWRLVFTREGLETYEMTTQVRESDRGALVNVTMTPPAPAAPDPMVAINAELQRAAGMMQKGDITGARAVYEALYAQYPQPFQFPYAIATTYLAEKNYAKALEYGKIAAEKDATSVDVKMLIAEVYMMTGQKAEASEILNSIDMTQVKDPVPFINEAIILINDAKPKEAIALLDKLLVQFPNEHQIYYYRGRAHLVDTNLVAAKADLEKFVSVAPADSKEVAAAKELIAKLSKQ